MAFPRSRGSPAGKGISAPCWRGDLPVLAAGDVLPVPGQALTDPLETAVVLGPNTQIAPGLPAARSTITARRGLMQNRYQGAANTEIATYRQGQSPGRQAHLTGGRT
jgi:hypothetical protein